MITTARLYVKCIPGLMKERFQKHSASEYIELTIIEALRSAVMEGLTQSQTEEWIDHWANQYAEDVSDLAFENGQHSIQLS